MSTVRNVINAFRHFAADRDGKPADEHALPNRLVYHYLRIYTNALQQALRANPALLTHTVEWDAYTIPCVRLSEVDVTDEIPTGTAPPSGCVYLKADVPVPETYEGRPVVVAAIAAECPQCDGRVPEFEYVPWHMFKDKIGSRIRAQREGLYYTVKLVGSRRILYVYANSFLSNIRGVSVVVHPKDPIDLLYYPNCGVTPVVCDVLDTEFRIPMDIETQVYSSALSALAQFRQFQPAADRFNNTHDDTSAPIKP